MRIRLIENYGYMLAGSMPDLPEPEAMILIRQKKAIKISDPHKSIDTAPKDKMVRRGDTRRKVK
ncbi:MAG: hypothetical protein KJ604_20525 [Gammaproteobacteria bacterium]|nr:hypothetical protein [Gammaproteobacteria bacterium]